MIEKPAKSCAGCILYEPPLGGSSGYIPNTGTGESGVLVIAEAGGQDEAAAGVPLVGKSGFALFQNLGRVGIDREGMMLHNVLSCRPPDNKLVKMWYENEVIEKCSPNLDATIAQMQAICEYNGKHLVIITLGRTAFKRVMNFTDKSPVMRKDYLVYPHWNDKYKAWVLAENHPAFLVRGNNHLWPTLQFTFRRALEIAENGLVLDVPQYLLDPAPQTFAQWVTDYFKELEANPTTTYLSYDIETPYKQGKDEGDLPKEDGDDWRILRCSFSYKPNEGVSVPWNASYLPYLEQLFASTGIGCSWNGSMYDDVRIASQVPMNLNRVDSMVAWHVLNSALPKGLGFVSPFYCKNMSMWKHLSDTEPAYYNSRDSDACLQNFIGIKRDLITNNLWEVYERHVIKLNEALNYMTGKGVLLDKVLRQEAETKLQTLLDVTEIKMEAAVPKEARRLHPKNGYKKVPNDLTGLVAIEVRAKVKKCSICGVEKPLKKHFKAGTVCEDGFSFEVEETVQRWAKPLEFKVSKLGLSKYQGVLKHQAQLSRKDRKITFDETAIMKLVKKYPNDPLYPLILEHREVSKLIGTYIGITQPDGKIRGGMQVGKDNRIHTTYNHNPTTLRLASAEPNLQNLPRPKGADDLASIIRNLVVAAPGHIFEATDFSGIEALLVGYFASSKEYMRLCKLDVHSYYTSYALNALDGRVSGNDLPLLEWDDTKLATRLAEIKKEFKHERNNLYKHLVHAINFGQGASGAQAKIFSETGVNFPLTTITKVMAVYKELFPLIPRWHQATLLQVEKDGFLRNPFGYVHRFSRPFEYEKIGGLWQKRQGPDSNKIWAFLPQSTASGIIKEALLRLYFNRFEEAGQYLRMQIHDELFSEVPEDKLDEELKVKQEEMGRPVPELRLPASFGMGEYLSVGVESKFGKRWGSMK